MKLALPPVILAAQYLEVAILSIKEPAVPPVAASKTSALTVTTPPALVVGLTKAKEFIFDFPTGKL